MVVSKLPKVIGAIRQYAPKLAKPKGKVSEKVLDLEKGKKTALKDAPALFYNSREVILDAPFEKNQAKNWLSYLKNRGVKDKELYDTSTTFFLQGLGNKALTKKDFIKEFDEFAPNLKVVALGQPAQKDIINHLFNQIKKIDPKTQDPRVEGFLSYLQTSIPNVVGEGGKVNQKALDKIATNVDKYMKDVFGVESAMDKGMLLTENVPFAVKEPLVALSAAMEKRGVGLRPKDYKRPPSHAGQQMMPGGDNYREFMFRYEPGKLRKGEPVYELPSVHHFGLAEKDRANAFVWARVSDRTDEFGRRIMFVEEIQSDMHQPIQRLMRKAKAEGKLLKREEGYASRGDLPPPEELLANKQQFDLVSLQIENLLATNPRSKMLPKLDKEREKIRVILEEAKSKKGVGGGSVPEGPFQNSQEYMEFVAKYLVRVAKDGKYDGVAFANPQVKNRTLSPGDRSYIGNLSAYGPILNKALSNASKKTGANLLNTVIRDQEGRIYGNVKLLNLKGNKMAEEIISKGVSAYSEGGLVYA